MQPSEISRNAFHRTLVGLEYADSDVCELDLYSKACMESYKYSDPTQFGYQFTQIFEPGVLHEIALLQRVPIEKLVSLEYQPTKTISDIHDRLYARQSLSAVERIHLASVLVSVSRFDAAERALPETTETVRERYELAWLEFLISNRRDDGAQSNAAFSRLRAAVDEGGIPPGRIVDACTQGIVWYLKRREVNHELYSWCLSIGKDLIDRGCELGSGTISSWYRGLAMVPAAARDAEATRKYMNRAYEHATRVAEESHEHGALNSLKTYYESCIKEFIYVRPDLESAVQTGIALIDLDKHWSPSYAEVAEAYAHFDEVEKATQYFEKAVEVGPPYVGLHLANSATCRARLGHVDQALKHYLTLNELAPAPNERICREALRLAEASEHELRKYFEDALRQICKAGVDV